MRNGRCDRCRAECQVLVLGHRHLERILREYVDHSNRQRPHRGIGLTTAGEIVSALPTVAVRRHDVLGGLIHEYHPVAA